MGIKYSTVGFTLQAFLFCVNNVCYTDGGQTCTRLSDGYYVQEYCQYGCCGTGSNQACCTISTSVLIAASVVSGLVLVSLLFAIIICCWKNYQDKRATRVRRLRQHQQMNVPRNPGVEPPKPPAYVSAPPAYSEEMPESHYRPPTVSDSYTQRSGPYNQRFRGATPTPRAHAQNTIRVTNASGRYPMVNTNSIRNVQIPGSIEVEAPPPYTQNANRQVTAHRRGRFIRTPMPEGDERVEQNINNTIEESRGYIPETTMTSDIPAYTSRAEQSRTIASGAAESRVSSQRIRESHAESSRDTESRAQTVARVLRHSRISHIPTRVHGMQSRQLSDVQSHASSNLESQLSFATPSSSFIVTRNTNVVEEAIEELSVV